MSAYIFVLPPDLLSTLTPRDTNDAFPITTTSNQTFSSSESESDTETQPRLLTCTVCGVKAFGSVDEQREHFRGDWHKYNLKRKVLGRDSVKLDVWEEGVNSSISGSNSSTSSEEELRKGPASPLLWYTSTTSPSIQFGIYRSIFPSPQTPLSALQTEPVALPNAKFIDPAFSTRKWTLLMFGGGHFAGCVISLIPGKTGKNMFEEVVLRSKTFHRYTTRRKQGGSQSAHDGGKGKAKSAGAALRRYNEAALQDEVRELLTQWKEDLDESELIWLRCSKTNMKVFFDYEDAVLARKDSRLRSFPFPTRRATANELVRSFHELTHLKTSTLTIENVASIPVSKNPESIPEKRPNVSVPQSLPISVPLTPQEVFTKKASEMIRKGRLEALSNHLSKHPTFSAQPLLHLASSSSQPVIVGWLLKEKQLDPKVQIDGRTAYEVSAGREVRNVFRIAREEDQVGGDERWEGSGVPIGPPKETRDEANVKSKERKNRLKEKMRESRKARQVEIEEEPPEEKTVKEDRAGRLGGSKGLKSLTVVDGGGLTEEQKIKLERERRARAAEARLKAMGR